MYKKYIKRTIDVIFSIIFLILTFPIMLLLCIAIKIDSKGPIFYLQDRTGKNGSNFKMFKFRTMIVETHKNGKELLHDQRMTKVGHFIRKMSLDELPQFVNVLKGEMSIIGPRPWVPEYYAHFNEKQCLRVNVLPGITGLAQARGRNGINILQKIEYDIEYVERISFKMDIIIVLETIRTVLKREHAEIKQEEIKEEIEVLKSQNGFAKEIS